LDGEERMPRDCTGRLIVSITSFPFQWPKFKVCVSIA
jgi:hypothetical protein